MIKRCLLFTSIVCWVTSCKQEPKNQYADLIRQANSGDRNIVMLDSAGQPDTLIYARSVNAPLIRIDSTARFDLTGNGNMDDVYMTVYDTSKDEFGNFYAYIFGRDRPDDFFICEGRVFSPLQIRIGNKNFLILRTDGGGSAQSGDLYIIGYKNGHLGLFLHTTDFLSLKKTENNVSILLYPATSKRLVVKSDTILMQ